MDDHLPHAGANPYAEPRAPLTATRRPLPAKLPVLTWAPLLAGFGFGGLYLGLTAVGLLQMTLEARRIGWQAVLRDHRTFDLVLLTIGSLMIMPGSVVLAMHRKWVPAAAVFVIGMVVCGWLVFFR